MSKVVSGAVLALVTTLAGCAPVNTSVRDAADNRFRDIRSGESTREDIERLLGKPENRTAFHRLGEEVWDYRYATTWHMLLSVHFAADTGKVKYYTDTPDPAFHYNAWGIN
ncbi:MAG TPA: hypothetical protein VMK05_04560 [Burkholderiales bacterium]|nr:hypothetical protein [Burkholderiales bacterium]